MKQFTVLVFCLISVLATAIPVVDGQTNVPVPQNGSQVAVGRGARVTNVHANGPVGQNIARGPVSYGPRTTNSYAPRIARQQATNLQPNYSPFVRQLNPTLAAMSVRENARIDNGQQATRILGRNDVAADALPVTNAQRIVRPYSLQQTRDIPARREITQSGLRPPNAQIGGKTMQPANDGSGPHQPLQSGVRHNRQGKDNRLSYFNALRCHRGEWHNRDWWRQNCNTIVFVTGGYYFLDGSYWYPAFGYDPPNSYYDYDGPIYTYGNLLPDEVIANVQVALQDAGYYFGAITGSLNVETRAALANYQRDQGLLITGAIDEPTVESLGLY